MDVLKAALLLKKKKKSTFTGAKTPKKPQSRSSLHSLQAAPQLREALPKQLSVVIVFVTVERDLGEFCKFPLPQTWEVYPSSLRSLFSGRRGCFTSEEAGIQHTLRQTCLRVGDLAFSQTTRVPFML